MRPHLAIFSCLLMGALTSFATTEARAVKLRAVFGVTAYLPLHVPRTKAADYVPQADRVVPAAIKGCGGRDLNYRTATDGAAAVYFTSSLPIRHVRDCMAKALPQVTIEPAS